MEISKFKSVEVGTDNKADMMKQFFGGNSLSTKHLEVLKNSFAPVCAF